MPKHSKLDLHRDQIITWIEQGLSDARIATKLEEYKLKITGQAVGNYRNKIMAPMLSKVSAKANLQLETFEQVAVEALSKYAALCAKSETDMTIGERNYFRTLGEWFDRIAKLRGLYAPQVVSQIAVQVNIADFKKRLWDIVNPEGVKQ